MGGVRPFRVEALHTLALFALAISQPVFSTIGEAPQFLVAHNATPLVIVAFAVGLALIAPLAIIIVEWLVGRIYRPAGKVLHGLVVLVLLLIIAQQVLDRFFDLDLKLLIGLSAAIALGASLLYWRSATVSRMVAIAAIGALLLPLNFLFVSPASKLVLGKGGDVYGEVSLPKRTPPIVLIIFDEFNPTVLLDENKQIDEVRYPNFAALAKDSWWFTRATSAYHQTVVAVPAILTGKRPAGSERLPTFTDHPRNIFTMLGQIYRMNVHELMTALCPSSLCKGKGRDFKGRVFVSDLFVVLGYSALPEEIATEMLPSLEGSWNGFGTQQKAGDFAKALGEKLRSASRTQFIDNFIASSGQGAAHFDFIHVHLPHAPYEFLPSGRMYNSTRYQLGAEGGVWGDNQSLIDLEYHRYMLQVGLLDRKLGELVDHLKERGVYDDALFIVTADHGRSFARNRPIKKMTDENSEVLHVPLFIKRPGQTEGRISDAPASTLDILPTIAAELGIDHSLDFDGAPLFSDELDGRERVALAVRGQNFDFSWDEVVRLPLLDWQAKTFTLRRPLDEVKINRRYSELIGTDLASLEVDVAGDAPNLRLLQNFQPLTNVDLKMGFLPALIDSEIAGEVPPGAWVLAALNGKVAAVSEVYSKDEATKYVSALLPEKLFRDNYNSLEVFLLREREGSRSIWPIEIETSTFEVDAAATTITSSKGVPHPIAKGKRFGQVDVIRVDGDSLRVSGWSIDLDAKKPTETVVIFSGDKFICATSPRTPRPDVAKAHRSSEVSSSGFSVVCPIRGTDVDRSELKIYGINREGEAAELRVPRG